LVWKRLPRISDILISLIYGAHTQYFCLHLEKGLSEFPEPMSILAVRWRKRTYNPSSSLSSFTVYPSSVEIQTAPRLPFLMVIQYSLMYNVLIPLLFLTLILQMILL
jgi:hypothetical protein